MRDFERLTSRDIPDRHVPKSLTLFFIQATFAESIGSELNQKFNVFKSGTPTH